MAEQQTRKHETVMDVTAERIAKVYAEAFWSVALKQPDPQATFDELQAVIADVLDKFPAFEAVLTSELVDVEAKSQVIDRVFARQLSPTVLNFLKVLANHQRLDLLRHVVRETAEYEREHLGQVEVEVCTAQKLDESIRDDLIKLLRERGNREPVLRMVIDPELVGGIIVKIGDRVYDGSLRRRFEMARRSIIARATDMIQTSRDQFINSAS